MTLLAASLVGFGVGGYDGFEDLERRFVALLGHHQTTFYPLSQDLFGSPGHGRGRLAHGEDEYAFGREVLFPSQNVISQESQNRRPRVRGFETRREDLSQVVLHPQLA
jgi:hypothetical protein